jgi:AGCS family alanine or glycine:cation symporter
VEPTDAATDGFVQLLEQIFTDWVVAPIEAVVMFDVAFWDPDVKVPLVVLWLILGATWFTLRLQFVNLRGFRHAVDCVRGRYTGPDESGEISHFQALSAALSATVGLGNIAGVAFAIGIGGPGAVFWMVLAGFLGMSTKFAECTLGQKYRVIRPDGHVSGGPMHYLKSGLVELGWVRLGGVLAPIFAVMCIGGSFGGGNMYQSNQAYTQVASVFPGLDHTWGAIGFGLVLAVLVGLVIIGGIKRIASTAEKIVPLMCGIYVLASLYILIANYELIDDAFGAIIDGAFSPKAYFGGFLGVLAIGFKRAAFSNEAGAGSAAIAHSAARTPHPAREGIVALLEPFIDTVVVCTMTALVIVITGAYQNPEYSDLVINDQGAALTSRAYAEVLPWFPYVLSVAVMLFAFSTLISWSYYGERCWAYLFGDNASTSYRLVFIGFVFLGSILTATNVLKFGDLMILGMAFPNIFGIYFLTGKVRASLDDYWSKLKSGEFPRYK